MRRLLALAALAGLTTPLAAEETPRDELTVLGGVSLLDVKTESDQGFEPIPLPGPAIYPPIRFPEIRIREARTLGGSFVLGLRYGRYVMSRVALEVDFAVAPSHELGTALSLCVSDRGCRGGAESAAAVAPDLSFLGARQTVVAYHYGAGLAFDLLKGDVRPILLVGVGGVSWARPEQTETDLDLRFGAGVKLYFGTLGVRLEVVDHVETDNFVTGKTEHDVQASAGFIVRF